MKGKKEGKGKRQKEGRGGKGWERDGYRKGGDCSMKLRRQTSLAVTHSPSEYLTYKLHTFIAVNSAFYPSWDGNIIIIIIIIYLFVDKIKCNQYKAVGAKQQGSTRSTHNCP